MKYYKKARNVLIDTLMTYEGRVVYLHNLKFCIDRTLKFVKKEEDSTSKQVIIERLQSILKAPSLLALAEEIMPLLEKQIFINEINQILNTANALIIKDATSETSEHEIKAFFEHLIKITEVDASHPFFYEAQCINKSANSIHFNSLFTDKLLTFRCSTKPMLESISLSLNHHDYFELIHTIGYFIDNNVNINFARAAIRQAIIDSSTFPSPEETNFKNELNQILSDTTHEANYLLSKISVLLHSRINDSSSKASLLRFLQSQDTSLASEETTRAVEKNVYWEELLDDLTHPEMGEFNQSVYEQQKPKILLWKQRQTERLLGGTKASLKTPAEVLEGLERKSANELLPKIRNKYTQ